MCSGARRMDKMTVQTNGAMIALHPAMGGVKSCSSVDCTAASHPLNCSPNTWAVTNHSWREGLSKCCSSCTVAFVPGSSVLCRSAHGRVVRRGVGSRDVLALCYSCSPAATANVCGRSVRESTGLGKLVLYTRIPNTGQDRES